MDIRQKNKNKGQQSRSFDLHNNEMFQICSAIRNTRLCSSNFSIRPEQLLSPLPTNSLKATDYIPANFTGFSVFQTAVPFTSLDPPRAFFTALFFSSDVSDEFTRRP
jgi:hypothetical protein